jgi:hypothetical protein
LVSWWRAKKELAVLTLTQETSQKELDGGVRNRTAEALWRRYECFEKA